MVGWAPGSDAVQDAGGGKRKSSLYRRWNRTSRKEKAVFFFSKHQNINFYIINKKYDVRLWKHDENNVTRRLLTFQCTLWE